MVILGVGKVAIGSVVILGVGRYWVMVILGVGRYRGSSNIGGS